MKFNFQDSLQKGHDAAETALENINQINEVMISLNESIGDYLQIVTKLDIIDELVKPSAAKSSLFETIFMSKTGFQSVRVSNDQGIISKPLFKMKKQKDGYPVTIKIGMGEYMCETQEELVDTISEIISKPDINLILRNFKLECQKKAQELNN